MQREDTGVRRHNAQLAARNDATSIVHLLVDDGIISKEQLKRALAYQQFAPRTPLGKILVDNQCLTIGQLQAFLAKQQVVRAPGDTGRIADYAHAVAELLRATASM